MSLNSATNPAYTQNLTLRPAIADDVDWAVPLLLAAGPALFCYVFASPAEQTKEILRQAFVRPGHAFSYEHTQVVEVMDEPAGLMLGYPGFLKKQADEKVHQVMARILPLKKLPKILVNLADLTRIRQDVSINDYYVLGLSILPEFRNQGLGTYLLHYAEEQAGDYECSSICLDITYTNTHGRSLLEKLGYEIVCSKSTARFDQMTRAGGIHRLIKNLI